MLYLRMFNESYINSSPVTGVTSPRTLEYIRRQYVANKTTIQNYYMSRKFAIRNTNIISRMLEHIPLSLNVDFYDYRYLAEQSLDYLGNTFQLTSAMQKGIVHPPYFYGNDGMDIIMSIEGGVDHSSIVENWRTAKCIRVLTHPRNDTKLLLPLGNDDGSNGGLSSISVDLMALALKYREFLKEQVSRIESGDSAVSKQVFITRYVIPTMLEDDIDHRLLNMIIDRFYGREFTTPKFKHTFPINEPLKQLNDYIDDTLDIIKKKDMDFVNILNNIQLVFSLNANDLLMYRDVPNTRQSNWALIVSRLKYMVFLYDVAKKPEMSRHHIEDWRRMAIRLRKDSAMLGNFDRDLKNEVMFYLSRIENM